MSAADRRAQDIAVNKNMCASMGLTDGTVEFRNCVVQGVLNDMQVRANNQASGFALMGAGAAILSQPKPAYAPPPPQQCSSYVNGQYISTRCW